MYALLARFRMVSQEGAWMELRFVKEDSVSQKEKVKAFWKFLDAQNNLQPYEGIAEHESPPKTEASISSMKEMMKAKDIWRKGLKIFRQLGLDRTALAADNRCELCLVQKTIQCDDLADTVVQPYEELKADMRAFEERQGNRASN